MQNKPASLALGLFLLMITTQFGNTLGAPMSNDQSASNYNSPDGPFDSDTRLGKIRQTDIIKMLKNYANYDRSIESEYDGRSSHLESIQPPEQWNQRGLARQSVVKLSNDGELEFCAHCLLNYGLINSNECYQCYSKYMMAAVEKRTKPASKYWHSRAG